jgi:hypothetical protein
VTNENFVPGHWSRLQSAPTCRYRHQMGTNCSGAPRTLPSHAHTQNRADRGPLSDLSKDRAHAVPTLALLLFFSRTVIDANQGATCACCVLQQGRSKGIFSVRLLCCQFGVRGHRPVDVYRSPGWPVMSCSTAGHQLAWLTKQNQQGRRANRGSPACDQIDPARRSVLCGMLVGSRV